VVKVDPRELPRAANIHWLGQRDYRDLPRYVKAFDVCLMPFALNDATEYINPTKTLEYMAAAKPIVSTPVADVVHNFTPVVRVARSAEEFVAAARAAAAAPDAAMIERGIRMAQNSSWEAIVQHMRGLIADAVVRHTALEADALAATGGAGAAGWSDDAEVTRVRGAVATGSAEGARTVASEELSA